MSTKSNSALLWVVAIVIVVLGIVYFSKSGQETSTEPTETPQAEQESKAEIPEGPITLGAMAPLSGEAVVYGVAFKSATDLAVEEINAAGGVDGHELKIVWEDSKCSPQDGATAAQKLVEVNQLKYLIGTVCSGSTLAAAAITEPAGVLLFSAGATSPDLSTAGDFVFRTYPSDGVGGQVLAAYTYKELKKMKLAILSEQTDYAQGLRKTIKETFTKLGGQVVADETYNTGDTDFRTQILKMKAAEPDVVFVDPQTPVSGVLVLKQLQENSLNAQVLVNDAMLSGATAKENAAYYENVYSATPELDETREPTKKMLEAYQARYNKAPEYPAYLASSYDQVYMLAQAFSEVGTDPAAVRDWLYQVKDWPGALGNITIDENGDPLIGYSIKKVTKGEIESLGAYSL